MIEFKHEMGLEVITRVTKLKGIITARSDNLYGCNRYYIQPKANKEGKNIDGWWVDEDDIVIKGRGLAGKEKRFMRGRKYMTFQ